MANGMYADDSEPCFTDEYNERVSVIRMEPHCLVPGTRLRAKPWDQQTHTPRQPPGVGDAWIRAVHHPAGKGPRYVCQTFVWRNEITMTFEELIGIFCEATLPKGPGDQLWNLLFPVETT